MAYPLIGKWIWWKIKDGKCVKVGEDPWMGAGENFKLSPILIQILRSTRIFTIVDACKDSSIRGRNQWKNTQDIGQRGSHAEEWKKYLNMLVSNHIHLRNQPKKLIWMKNSNIGQYTTKLGYQAISEE